VDKDKLFVQGLRVLSYATADGAGLPSKPWPVWRASLPARK